MNLLALLTELIEKVKRALGLGLGPLKEAVSPITFVGDSITAFNNWQAAFRGKLIFNQGVAGDTTLQIMDRLGIIQSTGAKTYIMMMGINDIWGWKYDAPNTASRIFAIRNNLLATGARVVVQSTVECSGQLHGYDTLNRVRELNNILKSTIPQEDYLDINCVLSDGNGLKLNYTYDGIHLNKDGYAEWHKRLRSSGLL
jgi:lysophospholipase L1-like esterase